MGRSIVKTLLLNAPTTESVGDEVKAALQPWKIILSGSNKIILKRLAAALEEMIDVVYAKCQDGTYFRPDDHTLTELRRLGHPYARRNDSAGSLHDPPEIIHIQDSHGPSLFFTLKKETDVSPDNKIYRAAVVFGDTEAAYYWKYLKYGTTKMVPRRIDQRIRIDHEAIFRKILKDRIGKAFKELVTK